MQYPLYTFDTKQRVWEISLIDEEELLKIAASGQLAEDSLIYNTATQNFISAREYALLVANARGPRMRPVAASRPKVVGVTKNSIDRTRQEKTPARLPRVPTRAALAALAAASERAVPVSPVSPVSPVTPPAPQTLPAPPAPRAGNYSDYSLTDRVIESYVPTFRKSIRLQTAGVLTLPVFGLGLPLLIEGRRRHNNVLRLVEQTGMEKSVWLTYVSRRAAGFRSEQQALRLATVFVFLAAAGVGIANAVASAGVRSDVGRAVVRLMPSASRKEPQRAAAFPGLRTSPVTVTRNTQ